MSLFSFLTSLDIFLFRYYCQISLDFIFYSSALKNKLFVCSLFLVIPYFRESLKSVVFSVFFVCFFTLWMLSSDSNVILFNSRFCF